jgi:hypothetical protein
VTAPGKVNGPSAVLLGPSPRLQRVGWKLIDRRRFRSWVNTGWRDDVLATRRRRHAPHPNYQARLHQFIFRPKTRPPPLFLCSDFLVESWIWSLGACIVNPDQVIPNTYVYVFHSLNLCLCPTVCVLQLWFMKSEFLISLDRCHLSLVVISI